MADPVVTDVTIPYEILIRFGDDGAFKGAHQVRRRRVTVGGELVNEQELPAEPLAGEAFAAAIGEAAAMALADASTAVARAVVAEREAGEARAALAAVEEHLTLVMAGLQRAEAGQTAAELSAAAAVAQWRDAQARADLMEARVDDLLRQIGTAAAE